MFIATLLSLCAAVKILGALEWAPLYRVFLFVPAHILGFFFAAGFDEQGGVYAFPGFILDHSCSGIHFFIVAVLLLGFKSKRTWVGSLKATGAAYLLTLAANTARVGLYLKVEHFSPGRPWLHEAIGTLVFITFLIAFYFIWDYRRIYGTEKQTP